MKSNSLKLASWIIQNSQSEISPLKLQKLAFYCYAAACSKDLEDEIGVVEFDAWKYGPVVVDVYDEYKRFGSSAIKREPLFDDFESSFSTQLTQLLMATLSIYERLTPSQLVHQTHLEDPWIKAYNSSSKKITIESIKSYFKMRFATNMIAPPEMLKDTGFFEIDGLPVQKFASLEDLANSLAR